MTSKFCRYRLLRAFRLLIGTLSMLAVGLAPAQTFSTLYSFSGPDGNGPTVQFFQGSDVLGTTTSGGPANCGTIFKLDDTGTQSLPYGFSCGTSGGGPSSLIQDLAGNLAGTAGVVFEVDSNGQETVLHPYISGAGNLVQDAVGNFYGTAQGGAYSPFGVVFKLDASAALTVLHSFAGTDGQGPRSLVHDNKGNLYGITGAGGTGGCTLLQHKIGCGVIFKIDPNGQFSILHTFNVTDGEIPTALLIDSAGNLYGTTDSGPNSGCCGLVFKLIPGQSYNLLYTFPIPANGTGVHPNSLVRDKNGNFYGTTRLGGDPKCNCGVLFKLDSNGNSTVLHTFTGGSDGTSPNSLLQDSAGNLVGTARGGAHGAGIVFKFFLLDFSLAASALSPATVSPGGSASSTIDFTASGGFNDSVVLSCSVTPRPARAPQCSISPGSITPGSPATLTVTTTAPTRASLSSSGSGLFYALWLPLIGCVAVRAGGQKSRLRHSALVLGCVLITVLMFQTACGGGSPITDGGGTPGTPAGTYTVTIIGADMSGTLQHSTTTTITVQ
jgi:uncharacterized repeat protein (TIGR03803 family)